MLNKSIEPAAANADYLVSKRHRHVKTELLAGVSSFLTMAYIAFVNPAILHEAGLDQGAVFTATCLVSAFACVLTGLLSNMPIGVAPGMAINIYFTYSVVKELGVDWHQALAMVFVSGVAFFLVSLTRLRRLLIEAIPHHLQIAILIGISLMIALISLETNHIIVRGEQTLLHLGDITQRESLLFFVGFLMILALDYYRVRGAIILTILSMTLISLCIGLSSWQGIIAWPPSMSATFLKLDCSNLLNASSLKITFTLFLITVFDASGTLVGLLNQPLFKGRQRINRAIARSLTADAASCALAGLLGTSSTSPYIESAAGIQSGGRTGLTAVTIGVGFLLMLFFFPLAQTIPSFAVGPVLLYVACCMMKNLAELDLTNLTEIAPALVIMMMIPFTSSIADGIGSGIILYVLLHYLTGQKVNPLAQLLGLLFIVFFIMS